MSFVTHRMVIGSVSNALRVCVQLSNSALHFQFTAAYLVQGVGGQLQRVHRPQQLQPQLPRHLELLHGARGPRHLVAGEAGGGLLLPGRLLVGLGLTFLGPGPGLAPPALGRGVGPLPRGPLAAAPLAIALLVVHGVVVVALHRVVIRVRARVHVPGDLGGGGAADASTRRPVGGGRKEGE